MHEAKKDIMAGIRKDILRMRIPDDYEFTEAMNFLMKAREDEGELENYSALNPEVVKTCVGSRLGK